MTRDRVSQKRMWLLRSFGDMELLLVEPELNLVAPWRVCVLCAAVLSTYSSVSVHRSDLSGRLCVNSGFDEVCSLK